MVEGYDAADPSLASTFALRDEWMGDGFGKQMRIREGYGALTAFLETECKIYGADIRLNSEVETIDVRSDRAKLICGNGDRYEVARVLVTIPLPLLFQVVFLPALPKKMEAARNIGFGEVIKIVLKFRTRWWLHSQGKDLGNMFILRSNEVVPVWWTQYPEHYPVLTGWLSGPEVKNYMNMSSDQMLSIGLLSLANNFDVDVNELDRELVTSKIVNWPADRYARGAYTYATLATPAAKEELLKPINGVLFFSGEALYEGKEVGTVEAALASGAKAAERILRPRDALGERGGE
jgi:monoamine oxidase